MAGRGTAWVSFVASAKVFSCRAPAMFVVLHPIENRYKHLVAEFIFNRSQGRRDAYPTKPKKSCGVGILPAQNQSKKSCGVGILPAQNQPKKSCGVGRKACPKYCKMPHKKRGDNVSLSPHLSNYLSQQLATFLTCQVQLSVEQYAPV
ncbi:MAG TPA: hypothetical protein DCZ55_06460 [Cyanobacteria bacterium UBA11371]|nr:hypothetical protein [Cyanobacteria bacterium UBA11371]